jgi:hypothetical protein
LQSGGGSVTRIGCGDDRGGLQSLATAERGLEGLIAEPIPQPRFDVGHRPPLGHVGWYIPRRATHLKFEVVR